MPGIPENGCGDILMQTKVLPSFRLVNPEMFATFVMVSFQKSPTNISNDMTKNLILAAAMLLAGGAVAAQPFRPINDSVNVLANDPARSNSPNNVEHRGPQVAVVFCTSPLSCEAERLARESTGKHVDTVFPDSEVGRSDVFILFCIREVIFQYFAAKRIDLAVEGVRPARPLGRQIEPSDSAEKRGVGHKRSSVIPV